MVITLHGGLANKTKVDVAMLSPETLITVQIRNKDGLEGVALYELCRETMDHGFFLDNKWMEPSCP